MRPLAILIAVSATVFTCGAQGRGGSAGGHGGGYSGVGRSYFSYGGAGHSNFVSPPPASILNPGVAGGGSAWRGYGGGYRNRYYGGGAVLFAYPMFYGVSPYDYGYFPSDSGPATPPPGYYDDSQNGAYGPPPGAPAVVINQNFVPPIANPMVRDYGPPDQGEGSGMSMYQNVPPRSGEAEATIYLIAFKDHTVVPALGWWVEGRTIKYVTLDHNINQASVDLIDRDLSHKLNAQRNIDFTLPQG